MPSLRQIADLLSSCTSLRAAEPILSMLGFGESLPVGHATRVELGLDEQCTQVRIAAGPGLLRIVLIRSSPSAPLRPTAARAAVQLRQRSPQLLWLICMIQPATHAFVVAVPPTADSHRVSALVVDTRRVHASDAETVAAMSDAQGASDLLTHLRWRELLGRDSLTRRFYRELESTVGAMADSARGDAPAQARREIALLCTSRLLFLAFLEAKGWLDGDREFLRHRYDERCLAGGHVHSRFLDPLFFGTLNTPVAKRARAAQALGRVPFLNGGLFARAPIERRWRAVSFCDDDIGRVICDLLGRYRVTAHEETSGWNEAAVDPEMLGRAFESLMVADDRRRSGVFYTPRAILERLTAEGIDEWLASVGVPDSVRKPALAGEPVHPSHRAQLLDAVSAIRILDPACGSGAFLVHALERIADIRRAAGDGRATSVRRRDVLTQSIFGVDINPTAVWLCELRLWLSTVIDSDDRDGLAVPPLPNLDHHIRVGDALGGAAFEEQLSGGTPLSALRLRYTRAVGVRKRTLSRALDSEERQHAIREFASESLRIALQRRDMLSALRGRDLFGQRLAAPAPMRATLAELRTASREARRRLRAVRAGGALPFSFRAQFADVGTAGGFDLIVGNPPWVRIHRQDVTQRTDYARRYRCWREAAWADGAADSAAGRGFSSQVDLSALFVERATQLVKPGGVVSLLVPAKLWTSLSGGGVRRLLRDTCHVAAIEDWSESPAAFDAVVYPSMMIARRRALWQALRQARVADRRNGTGSEPAVLRADETRAAVHHREHIFAWAQPTAEMPLDASNGAPWIFLPPDARGAFDLLVARGTRLAHSPLGRPLLGVKTGCNDAFMVVPDAGWREPTPDTAERCVVRAMEREGLVERALLRPALRGEDIRPWRTPSPGAALVFPHGSDGGALARLPRHAAHWLAPWRRQLESRSDHHHGERWWSLFRTESADASVARVVWSDISRVPRATVLERGDPTVALNTCYSIAAPSLDDALAFAALLNSAPAAAWLSALAEPARGGYRRYLGWTLARFPVPADWPRAVEILAPLAADARLGSPPTTALLTDAVAKAYRIRPSRLEPLLTWSMR